MTKRNMKNSNRATQEGFKRPSSKPASAMELTPKPETAPLITRSVVAVALGMSSGCFDGGSSSENDPPQMPQAPPQQQSPAVPPELQAPQIAPEVEQPPPEDPPQDMMMDEPAAPPEDQAEPSVPPELPPPPQLPPQTEPPPDGGMGSAGGEG